MFDPRHVSPQLIDAGDARAARIEEAGLNAAQPAEQLLFDGWLLRYAPGKARRARSVNAISAGRLPLQEKLAHCRGWYAKEGLPCLFRITPFSRPRDLDGALAQSGFVAEDETHVMTLTLGGAVPTARHEVREIGVAEFAQQVGRLRGSSARQIAAHEVRLSASPLLLKSRRLALEEEGRIVAVGQSVPEGELVGLYDIVTAGDARGRGLATALTVEMLRRALSDGARTAYLQVSADNIAGRRVYSKLGFVDRYAYWYRTSAGAVQPGQVGEGAHL
jgi:ribosomal protein S18 acetylase RimI-like enzyme